MAAKHYRVDWDDQAFPKIREAPEGVTLQEAKQEIYRYAKGMVNHWREVVRYTRSLTARSVPEQGRVYSKA
jgi:hypothetical protein